MMPKQLIDDRNKHIGRIVYHQKQIDYHIQECCKIDKMLKGIGAKVKLILWK